MKGILTSCFDGTEKEVELEYKIEEREERKIFWIIGGVTGWESFYIDKEGGIIKPVLKDMSETGWLACAGTKGRWDKLFIPGVEMKKVFEKEGLL